LKSGSERSSKASAGSSAAVNTKSPPARPRVGKVGAAKEAGTPSPTLKRATTSNIETKKRVFSPIRDPHGNSGSTGDISGKLSKSTSLRTMY
jgi:protein NEDD1